MGIRWPPIGNSNTHLEISDKLEVCNFSAFNDVEFYETLLTLAAPVMSGCVSERGIEISKPADQC